MLSLEYFPIAYVAPNIILALTFHFIRRKTGIVNMAHTAPMTIGSVSGFILARYFFGHDNPWMATGLTIITSIPLCILLTLMLSKLLENKYIGKRRWVQTTISGGIMLGTMLLPGIVSDWVMGNVRGCRLCWSNGILRGLGLPRIVYRSTPFLIILLIAFLWKKIENRLDNVNPWLSVGVVNSIVGTMVVIFSGNRSILRGLTSFENVLFVSLFYSFTKPVITVFGSFVNMTLIWLGFLPEGEFSFMQDLPFFSLTLMVLLGRIINQITNYLKTGSWKRYVLISMGVISLALLSPISEYQLLENRFTNMGLEVIPMEMSKYPDYIESSLQIRAYRHKTEHFINSVDFHLTYEELETVYWDETENSFWIRTDDNPSKITVSYQKNDWEQLVINSNHYALIFVVILSGYSWPREES